MDLATVEQAVYLAIDLVAVVLADYLSAMGNSVDLAVDLVGLPEADFVDLIAVGLPTVGLTGSDHSRSPHRGSTLCVLGGHGLHRSARRRLVHHGSHEST